jgi:hypothetical protein
MTQKTQDEINSNLSSVLESKNTLDVLLEFENMLDSVNIYAFKNWKYGEVVDGPKLGRHWVTVTLMYPYKMMPDPSGAKRLVSYDCKVNYTKATYITPVKIKTAEDLETDDKGRRVPKKVKKQIWLVEITMPRRFIDDDAIAVDDADIDQDAVEEAYDDNLDSEGLAKGNEDMSTEGTGQEQEGAAPTVEPGAQ